METRAVAADLTCEEAARLRDEIRRLEALDLGLSPDGATDGRPRGRSIGGAPGTGSGKGLSSRPGKPYRPQGRRRRGA